MSTRIYNGFLYTGSGGFTGCYHAMGTLREKVEEVAIEKYLTTLGRQAAEIIDRRVLKLKLPQDSIGKSPLGYARANWTERTEVEKLNKSKPSVPTDDGVAVDCLVHLFPMGKRVLGIFEGSREHRDMFFDQPFIEDYSYWNNTDGPDNISDRDWEKRHKDWDKAFPSFPSQRSAIMHLGCEYEPWILLAAKSEQTAQRVMEFLPTISSRAKAMASPYMRAHGMYEDRDLSWIMSEEGLEAKEHVEAELTLKLPSIDETTLTMK